MADSEEMARSFIGCILTLKMKPGADGISANIIGTVRHIDIVDQTMTLDGAMCNGEILDDGFVLRSSQIADLNVCGKSVGDEILTLVEADFKVGSVPGIAPSAKTLTPVAVAAPAPIPPLLAPIRPDLKKREKENVQVQILKRGTVISGTGPQFPQKPFLKNDLKQDKPRNPTAWKTPVSEKQINIKMEAEDSNLSKGRRLEASLGIGIGTSSGAAKPKQQQHQQHRPAPQNQHPPSSIHPGASAKPSNDPRVVYVASETERNYFEKSRSIKNEARSGAGLLPTPTQPPKPQPPPLGTTSYTRQVNTQKYPQLTLQNTTPTCVLQKLVQIPGKTKAAAPGAATAPTAMAPAAPNGSSHLLRSAPQQSQEDLETTNPFYRILQSAPAQGQKKVMDMKDVAKALPQPSAKTTAQSQGTKILNHFISQQPQPKHNPHVSPLNQPQPQGRPQNGDFSNGNGNGKPQPQGWKLDSTFEMTNDEIFAEEFDFEESNAMFEKLPVDPRQPVRVQKQPQFCQTDTTYVAERTVESIKLQGVAPIKNFVSDTGIVIPAVDLSTRSRILNISHECGLTHSRMVEVMGRAVAQTCVPFLGNSFRLSPEREDDRPTVLVCTGPNWQGAAGICAARILASQGVKTYVYAKKLELNLCSVEEKLYAMTGQKLTRESFDLLSLKFDLVIFAKDSHTEGELSLGPVYYKWMQNVTVVLIDPPALPNYRCYFDSSVNGNSEKVPPPARICVLTPSLPLAYGNDPFTKFFLVNMGIPQAIYAENGVLYKSPFGDKLTIQIFSEKVPSSSSQATHAS